MFSAIFSAIGGKFVDSLLGKVTGVFEKYFQKQVSMEELRTQLLQAVLETVAEIEKSHADALAKTYASFMQAMAQSRLMQAVWGSVVLSQLFVLVWHQMGIPLLVYITGEKFPSSGTTVEWAYLLLAGCLGMGPVVLRNGPGAGDIAWRIKSLIGK